MFYGNTVLKYQPIDIDNIVGLKEFNLEFENFSKLSASFDVITENQLVLQEGFFQTFVEKIKGLWAKFMKLIGGFIDKIKKFFLRSKNHDNMVKHAEQVNTNVQNLKIEELKKKIAELEEDNEQLKQNRDGYKQLATDFNKDYKDLITSTDKRIQDERDIAKAAEDRANAEKVRADAAEDKLAKGIDLSDLYFYSIDKNILDKIDIMNRGMHTMNWWSDISPERLQDVYDRDGINFTEELMNENKEVVESLEYLSKIDLDKVISSKHIEDYKYKYKDGVIENIEAIKRFSDAAWSASNRIGSVEDRKIEELDKDITKKQSQIDAITKMSGTEVSQEAANLAIKILKYNIETSKLWNMAAIKILAAKDKVITHNDKVFNTLEQQLGKIKITK
jgi:hypothetical protein